MYGNQNTNWRRYNAIRHGALKAGGTRFAGYGESASLSSHADVVSIGESPSHWVDPGGYKHPYPRSVKVPPVYHRGGGPQLAQALENRQLRQMKALYGLALRGFMKMRKGIPLTEAEKRAMRKVGGELGLKEFFSPKGIDVETVVQEGEIVELAPEEEVLANEALNGEEKAEGLSFWAVATIAGGVGVGLYLLGRLS